MKISSGHLMKLQVFKGLFLKSAISTCQVNIVQLSAGDILPFLSVLTLKTCLNSTANISQPQSDFCSHFSLPSFPPFSSQLMLKRMPGPR